MPVVSFEIRVCVSCGLRYPLVEGNSFGVRCPQCMGNTRVAVRKNAEGEQGAKREEKRENEKAVLLDNIRSAWNVGSILRSADGFGFTRAYLCGVTPAPNTDAARKTALGAENYVEWTQHKDAVILATALKKEGWKILALEESPRAQSIGQVSNSLRAVLIVGSEVTGVDPELLDLADEILYIPMRGRKRSFNAANAFAVAAYALSQLHKTEEK